MRETDQSTLVNLAVVFNKWKKFIILNTSIFTFLALIISLLLPKWYLGEAVILSGRSQISDLGLSSFVPDLPLGGLGLLPGSDESLRYLAILNSRTVLLKVAEKFDLQKEYDQPNWEKTLRALISNVSFELNPDETITVGALDKSPIKAAQMANYFVYLLDSLNIELKIEKAKYNRQFLETRLKENKFELSRAELDLKNFQETYGILDVTHQAQAAINSMAQLEANILIKSTELKVMSHYISADHPSIEELKLEIKSLQEALHSFKYGDGNSTNNDEQYSLLTKDVPELAMQYYRHLRDAEVQNILYKFLTQQFEQAKFMEAKETPTIQVLDKAVPPIYKNRPKRIFIVIGAFIFSIFMCLMYIGLVEKWHELKLLMDQKLVNEDS